MQKKRKMAAKRMAKKAEDWVSKAWEGRSKKPDPNALRSKDVAHILDCSPDDVIDKARDGKIPGAYKVGRFWRFKLAGVKKYQKEREKAR